MLNIDRDTLKDILDKARQFQAKDAENFSQTSDDMDSMYVLDDHSGDMSYQETVQLINGLRPGQQATLVALMYIGRGDFTKEEWDKAYRLAQEEITAQTGEYLLSRPSIADDILRALNSFGINLEE